MCALSLVLRGEEMSCGTQRWAGEWVCHHCCSQSVSGFARGEGMRVFSHLSLSSLRRRWGNVKSSLCL